MTKIRGADLRMLSHIDEKRKKMNFMQIQTGIVDGDIPGEQINLGYVFMEQIDTLKQMKAIETSIYNDHRNA